MLLKTGAKILAATSKVRFNRWYKKPVALQQKVFRDLIEQGRKTAFGREHGFDKVRDQNSFARQVPIREYEGFKPYIERISAGEKDVLWPGRPMYFSKTSGTTSGAKYIPITRASMPNHIESARQALLMYILKTGRTDFIRGRMIFISGSPELDTTNDIPTGRQPARLGRHQCGRSDQRHLGAQLGHGPHVAARDTGVRDVADDGNLEPFERALHLPDGIDVEQGLRRVLAEAVARIDYAGVDAPAEQFR
ncbi:MAG: GH3 auxin-responsive promoter family protein, partial [Bacteroidales bacterium]